MRNSLLILAIACLCWACDSVDDTLILKNQTQKDLHYTVLNDSLVAAYFPETNQSYKSVVRKIGANNTMNEIRPGPRGKSWRAYAKSAKDGFLHIFIFNLDTLKAYDWKDIVHQKRYVKEFRYNSQQLEQMNWEVIISE